MVDPVKFPSKSDVQCGIPSGAEVDEVEDMDFHILQPSESISVEMSRHFRFLHVVHHLVEMPLESLFQTVLGLTHILFLVMHVSVCVCLTVCVSVGLCLCVCVYVCVSGHIQW